MGFSYLKDNNFRTSKNTWEESKWWWGDEVAQEVIVTSWSTAMSKHQSEFNLHGDQVCFAMDSVNFYYFC